MSPARIEFGTYLRDALAECVSSFHELLFLAGFWDASAGFYIEPDSGTVLPHDATDTAASLHALVFEQWLGLSIAEQFAAFAVYLATLGTAKRQAFLQLLRCPHARAALIPPSAGAEQKDLFLLDLSLLEVLAVAK